MCVVVDGFRRQPQRTAAPQFCNHCTINSRCAHEITAELSVITATLTTALHHSSRSHFTYRDFYATIRMPAEKNEGVVASPPSLRSFLRSPWAALCLVMFLFVIYKSISSYEQHQLIRDFQGAYHQGSNSWLWDSKMDSKDKILFPQTFPNDDLAQYIQKHKLYPMDRLQSTTLIKYSPVGSTAERLSKPLKASHLSPMISIYFTVPPILSSIFKNVKPNFVKKSWLPSTNQRESTSHSGQFSHNF